MARYAALIGGRVVQLCIHKSACALNAPNEQVITAIVVNIYYPPSDRIVIRCKQSNLRILNGLLLRFAR